MFIVLWCSYLIYYTGKDFYLCVYRKSVYSDINGQLYMAAFTYSHLTRRVLSCGDVREMDMGMLERSG
jgi:hypothetical protein